MNHGQPWQRPKQLQMRWGQTPLPVLTHIPNIHFVEAAFQSTLSRAYSVPSKPGTGGEATFSMLLYDSDADAAYSSDDGEPRVAADETAASRIPPLREGRPKSPLTSGSRILDQTMEDSRQSSSPEISLREQLRNHHRNRHYLPDIDAETTSAPLQYAPLSDLRSTAGCGPESGRQAHLPAGGLSTERKRGLDGIAAAAERSNNAIGASSADPKSMEDVEMLESSDRTDVDHTASAQAEPVPRVYPRHSDTQDHAMNDNSLSTHAEPGSPIHIQPGYLQASPQSEGADSTARTSSQNEINSGQSSSIGGSSLFRPSISDHQSRTNLSGSAVSMQSGTSAEEVQDSQPKSTTRQNPRTEVQDHTTWLRRAPGTNPARQYLPLAQVARGATSLQSLAKPRNGSDFAYPSSGAASTARASAEIELRDPRRQTGAPTEPSMVEASSCDIYGGDRNFLPEGVRSRSHAVDAQLGQAAFQATAPPRYAAEAGYSSSSEPMHHQAAARQYPPRQHVPGMPVSLPQAQYPLQHAKLHHGQIQAAGMEHLQMQQPQTKGARSQINLVQPPQPHSSRTLPFQTQNPQMRKAPAARPILPPLKIPRNSGSTRPTIDMPDATWHSTSQGLQSVTQGPEVQQGQGTQCAIDPDTTASAMVPERRSSYPKYEQVSLSAFDQPSQVTPQWSVGPFPTAGPEPSFRASAAADPRAWSRLAERYQIPYKRDLNFIATQFGSLPEPRRLYELNRRIARGEIHHDEGMVWIHEALMEFGEWQMELALQQLRLSRLSEARYPMFGPTPGLSHAAPTVRTLPVSAKHPTRVLPRYLPPGRSAEDSLMCWSYYPMDQMGMSLASWREKYVDRQMALGRVDQDEGKTLKHQFQLDFYRESGSLANDPPKGPQPYLCEERPL